MAELLALAAVSGFVGGGALGWCVCHVVVRWHAMHGSQAPLPPFLKTPGRFALFFGVTCGVGAVFALALILLFP